MSTVLRMTLIYVVLCSAFVCAMIIFPTLLSYALCNNHFAVKNTGLHTSARVCMDMYVCMYVCNPHILCMYVCMYVCTMYVCTYVYVLHMHTSLHFLSGLAIHCMQHTLVGYQIAGDLVPPVAN